MRNLDRSKKSYSPNISIAVDAICKGRRMRGRYKLDQSNCQMTRPILHNAPFRNTSYPIGLENISC